MPFYPTTEKMAAPSSSVTTQIPISVQTTSNPSAATDKTDKHNQEHVRDSSVPIPLPYDRLSDDSGKSAGSSASVDLQTANDLELFDATGQLGFRIGPITGDGPSQEERNEMNKVGKKRNRKKDELRQSNAVASTSKVKQQCAEHLSYSVNRSLCVRVCV